MFPGSELSQIKDVNEKIRNTTQLINFSLSTQTSFGKKRKFEDVFSDSDCEDDQNSKKLNKKNKKGKKMKIVEMDQGTLVMNAGI